MAPQTGIWLNGAGLDLAGRPVLADLTLHLTEARIGIVGANGAGKSSLLRLIAGLVAPSRGSLRVEGHDPARDRKAMLSALGILFQNPDHQILFPTLIEELSFGLTQMGLSEPEAQARAEAQLAAEGRAHWRDVPCHHLSHGQRQHLCLMALLLMAPRNLLLDEPFAGLDLAMQARLSRRLDALPQRLITISHDPAAVEGAERVIWLDDGRVRADGPAGPVLAEFRAEMARRGASDADADLAG